MKSAQLRRLCIGCCSSNRKIIVYKHRRLNSSETSVHRKPFELQVDVLSFGHPLQIARLNALRFSGSDASPSLASQPTAFASRHATLLGQELLRVLGQTHDVSKDVLGLRCRDVGLLGVCNNRAVCLKCPRDLRDKVLELLHWKACLGEVGHVAMLRFYGRQEHLELPKLPSRVGRLLLLLLRLPCRVAFLLLLPLFGVFHVGFLRTATLPFPVLLVGLLLLCLGLVLLPVWLGTRAAGLALVALVLFVFLVLLFRPGLLRHCLLRVLGARGLAFLLLLGLVLVLLLLFALRAAA